MEKFFKHLYIPNVPAEIGLIILPNDYYIEYFIEKATLKYIIMNIIQKLQKLLYNLLSGNKQNIKVYSCSNKDINFPYIILELETSKIEEFFASKKHNVRISIKIFDKNETNMKIIEVTEEIRENLTKLLNTKIDNSTIVDIICESSSLEMYNGLNSVWNSNLKFKFVINEINGR